MNTHQSNQCEFLYISQIWLLLLNSFELQDSFEKLNFFTPPQFRDSQYFSVSLFKQQLKHKTVQFTQLSMKYSVLFNSLE